MKLELAFYQIITKTRAGEMAHLLRAFPAHVKDLGLVCLWQLTTSCNSSSKASSALFRAPQVPGMNRVCTHTCKQIRHKIKVNLMSLKTGDLWVVYHLSLREPGSGCNVSVLRMAVP